MESRQHTYQQRALAPELADLCLTFHVPEKLFSAFVSAESKDDILKHGTDLIRHFPSDQFKLKCILAMRHPSQAFEYIQTFDSTAYQIEFITTFLDAIAQECSNHPGRLCYYIPLIQAGEVKNFLLQQLGPSVIQSSIACFIQLELLAHNLPESSRPTFLIKLVGQQKVGELVKNATQLCELITLLPTENRLGSMMHLFEREKIQSYLSQMQTLLNIIQAFHVEDQFAFIIQCIGKAKLLALIDNKISHLIDLVSNSHDHYVMTLLFDVIGVESLRQILPFAARAEVAAGLPIQQRNIFLENLLEDHEKLFRQKLLALKHQIETIKFPTGLMGYSWTPQYITLDDGTTKTVPARVKKHWEFIQKALAFNMPCEQSWNEICESGANAANYNPFYHPIIYVTRYDETIAYYNQFAEKRPAPIIEHRPTA